LSKAIKWALLITPMNEEPKWNKKIPSHAAGMSPIGRYDSIQTHSDMGRLEKGATDHIKAQHMPINLKKECKPHSTLIAFKTSYHTLQSSDKPIIRKNPIRHHYTRGS